MKLKALCIILFVLINMTACDKQQANEVAILAETTPRYEATPQQGVDFKRDGLPTFVKSIKGLSGVEAWGQWSDASIAPTVTIQLTKPLIEKVSLELVARGIFENTKLPTKVRIGGVEQTIILTDTDKVYVLDFNLSSEANEIEIVPPRPDSPSHAGAGDDNRLLGIGLVSLKVFGK